jgi:hypothetical protein
MKKLCLIVLCLVASGFLLGPKQTLAAFVQFNPKTAQFVSPQDIKTSTSKSTTAKPAAKPAVLGTTTISDAYIKSLVTSTVNNMVAQGLIKGEKGDKGDSVAMPSLGSYNPDATGFQQVCLPGAVIGPDVGTFFSATNLSSDNITSGSASLGDIDSDGNLTLAGDADLQGSTSIATGTIASLNVGSLTSDSGAYLSDGGDWVNASSRTLKENLATTSPDDILSKIDNLPIYTWNYKSQNASTTHISPVAEDFYETFGLGGENGNKAISTIDPAGVALVGIQGLNEKLKSLLDFDWVLDGLKQLGIEIQNGFVKVQKLAADFISTKELEVGSSDQPTGITIYDRGTGQPVCIYSDNNVLKSESGKCQTGLIAQNSTENSTTQPEGSAPTAPTEDISSNTVATTTPDTTATSTPDLTLSNNN